MHYGISVRWLQISAVMAMCSLSVMAAGTNRTVMIVGSQAKPFPVAAKKAKATPEQAVVAPVSDQRAAAVASQPKPVAEESAGGVGVTAKIGTLGFGVDATIGASDYLGFRVGVNTMSLGPSISRDEGTITTDLDWLSYGVLADLHPFGGGFRISGGGLINKNKFKLKADLTKSVELDGQQYSLTDMSGEITFSELAPYFGIGYGNAVGADGNWHFSCDFGVMFQGSPKIAATATASDPALQPIVDEALANELKDIQNDANAFKYYPVISVGVSYRF